MKRSHQVLIFATSIVAGLGIGLYLVNKTELGSVIKGRLEQLNPISHDAMQTMSEEVAMRTAQATHNPKINQAWVERQWEELGY